VVQLQALKNTWEELDLNCTDDHGTSLLHHAAMCSQVATSIFLLKIMNDTITATDVMGRTAMHYSANSGSIEMVTLLLAHLDVNAADLKGDTPIHLAAAGGFLDVVRHLHQYGGNIRVRSALGQTPLHLACMHGRKGLVEWLLEDGGYEGGEKEERRGEADRARLRLRDVNGHNALGETPLHLAARSGHVQVLEVLLKNGADLLATRAVPSKPFGPALAAGDASVYVYVEERSVDLAPPRSDAHALLVQMALVPLGPMSPSAHLLGSVADGTCTALACWSGIEQCLDLDSDSGEGSVERCACVCVCACALVIPVSSSCQCALLSHTNCRYIFCLWCISCRYELQVARQTLLGVSRWVSVSDAIDGSARRHQIDGLTTSGLGMGMASSYIFRLRRYMQSGSWWTYTRDRYTSQSHGGHTLVIDTPVRVMVDIHS
jgi:hypothetical protein